MGNLGKAGAALAMTISLLGLAGTGPAAAESGAAVTVTDGALTVVGTDGPETVHLDQIAPETYAVWIQPDGGLIEVFNVTGVTGDVEIDTKGGTDRILVGTGTPTSLPGSLAIDPGDGLNKIDVVGVTIPGDLTATGRAVLKIRDTTIGDDLLGTTGAAGLSVQLTDTVVGDLYQVRSTGGGRVTSSFDRSGAGRIRITGGPLGDTASFRSSDLGTNPRMTLAGDNDFVPVTADVSWNGTFALNAGPGDDLFITRDEIDDGVPAPALLLGRFNVRLGTGDDEVRLDAPLQAAGSIVDGQGGTDRLAGDGVTDPSTVATFRSFEDVESQPGDPVTVTGGPDLTVAITEPIHRLSIDEIGPGFTVAYRIEDGGPLTTIDVAGVTGDVEIDLAAGNPLIEIGANSPTTLPGNLELRASGSAQTLLTNHRADIGGDLLITAAGSTIVRYESTESDVAGRLDLRATGSARFELTARDGSFGRVRINGGNADDRVVLQSAELGANPTIVLRNGADVLTMIDATWTGLLQANLGSGDDLCDQHSPLVAGRLRLLLGQGDDRANVLGRLDADGRGSRIQGDGGTDELVLLVSNDRALIRAVEAVDVIG